MTALRWIAIALLALSALAVGLYLRDMGRAYDRIVGASRLVPLPQGPLEFAEGGSGPPVLVVHGSGGGFDQGALVAQAVLGDGFRWVAPSRFGYLRSAVPAGATFDDQAHAYARLLDHLGLQQVAVVAMSHGGPSALLFAALYPQRVSSLTLLSCGVASSSDPAQAQANEKGNALTMVFKHDALYWAVSTLLRRQLMSLMGADEAVVAGLSPGQRRLVDRIIDEMNPASPRSAGVAFDNRAAMPNERIAAIRAPTLIVHARDDTLQLYRNAEFAAATIPGARLHAFERGGHLLIALQQQAIGDEVQRFILAGHQRSP
ncbi:alpha/beta fold hydrolase [Ideonella sp. A 288]|uniref:alpha/beta fold hydrolase n=1 Tax=Ideonella sp. A 288 TaxID=1962181 RepID=UPI000B4B6450|nr:alpha/beta hydrolase [Ideonella sp. A 288]